VALLSYFVFPGCNRIKKLCDPNFGCCCIETIRYGHDTETKHRTAGPKSTLIRDSLNSHDRHTSLTSEKFMSYNVVTKNRTRSLLRGVSESYFDDVNVIVPKRSQKYVSLISFLTFSHPTSRSLSYTSVGSPQRRDIHMCTFTE
jgi:hypothetical protein